MSIHFDPNYYNALQSGTGHTATTGQVQGNYALPQSSGGTGESSADALLKRLENDFPNLSLAVGDYDFMTNQPLGGASLGSGSGNFLISPKLLSRIGDDPELIGKFELMLEECEKSEKIEEGFLSGLGESTGYDSGYIVDDNGHLHGWSKPHTTTSQTGPNDDLYAAWKNLNPHIGSKEADTDDLIPNMVQSRAIRPEDGSHSILDKLADEKAAEINIDLAQEAEAEDDEIAKLKAEEDAPTIITSEAQSAAGINVQQLTSEADTPAKGIDAAEVSEESIGRLEQLSDLSRILSKLDTQRAANLQKGNRYKI